MKLQNKLAKEMKMKCAPADLRRSSQSMFPFESRYIAGSDSRGCMSKVSRGRFAESVARLWIANRFPELTIYNHNMNYRFVGELDLVYVSCVTQDVYVFEVRARYLSFPKSTDDSQVESGMGRSDISREYPIVSDKKIRRLCRSIELLKLNFNNSSNDLRDRREDVQYVSDVESDEQSFQCSQIPQNGSRETLYRSDEANDRDDNSAIDRKSADPERVFHLKLLEVSLPAIKTLMSRDRVCSYQVKISHIASI